MLGALLIKICLQVLRRPGSSLPHDFEKSIQLTKYFMLYSVTETPELI